jgi:hypothetical protein
MKTKKRTKTTKIIASSNLRRIGTYIIPIAGSIFQILKSN